MSRAGSPRWRMRPLRRGARSAAARQAGSTLIEVLVSLLLFGVAIIALLRTLGIALKDAGDVEYRAVAATVADAVIGRMWVDPGNLASYAGANVAVPELPNGTRTVTVNGTVVTVTVNWQPPGAAWSRQHTVVATLATN